jgi:hypothetical protein
LRRVVAEILLAGTGGAFAPAIFDRKLSVVAGPDKILTVKDC